MKKAVLSAFLVLLSISFAVPVKAANDLDISISPSILNIEALQPSQASTDITLQNMNENSHDFTITIQPFKETRDNNGTLEYIDVFKGPDPFIRQKVTFFDKKTEVTKVRLGPLESKTITMKIDIDNEAKSGDYYFSVIFMTTKENESTETTIKLPTGIATNVLLSIGKPGPATGRIDLFSGPFFLERGPVEFRLLLANTSDHFLLPTGNITLKNIFGQTVGKVDILPQYVLSETKRFLTDKSNGTNSSSNNIQVPKVIWKENALLGLYTATANIALSEEGPIIKKQIVFLAFPIIPALATILLITILLGIYLRVKKLL